MAHLNKVGELSISCCYETVHVVLQIALLAVIKGNIVLRKARLASPILQQYETYHCFASAKGETD